MLYIKKTNNLPVRFYIQTFQEVDDISSVKVNLFKADVLQDVEIKVLEVNGVYLICEMKTEDLSGEYVIKYEYNNTLLSASYCVIVDRFEDTTTQHEKENSTKVYEKE